MVDLETLRSYEARGLVKSSQSADGFTVWCYTQKCVAERAWDEVTSTCRGLVLDPDGSLVSRPFRKFHNYGEPEAVLESGPFMAFDKMDGTLIIVGNYNGTAIVSTKGSFSTWHSEAAHGLLLGFVPPEGHTAMFELIHPQNRIVVDYGDYEGLVFLGGVVNETGADHDIPSATASLWGWHGDVVVQRQFQLQAMINTVHTPDAGSNREGFVVVWPKKDGPSNRVKLKFDLYVKLHGIYTGLTNRRVWECLVTDSLNELMELAPDELHADIQDVAAQIREEAFRYTCEADLVVQEAKKLDTRKDQAELIKSRLDRPVSGLAFKLLDDKVDEARLISIGMARPVESRFVGSAGLS